MDLGIFVSSRKKLALWLVLPVFVLVIIYLSSSFYFNSAYNDLKEKESFIELMPLMEQKLQKAKEVLLGYKANKQEDELLGGLNSKINKFAKKSDFNLDSLSIQKVNSSHSPEFLVFQASIKGKGSFYNVFEFLENSRKENELFFFKIVNINIIDLSAQPVYSAEFELLYYYLK